MLNELQKKQIGTSVYTKLANKYNLPYQIIRVICNHPFLFASRRIAESDEKPLMFAYLGKIKMKKKYVEDSKTNKDTE